MKEVFRGREKELAVLDKRFKKDGFSMVVLYGRWRIVLIKIVFLLPAVLSHRREFLLYNYNYSVIMI